MTNSLKTMDENVSSEGVGNNEHREPLKELEVTTGILYQNGRFFCGRRKPGMSMAGKWEFPGGKIEKGETAEQCVVRKLNEELHVRAEILKKLGVIVHDYSDFRIILHVFVCRITDGKTPWSSEHSDADWRTPAELEKLAWDECDIRIFPPLKEWLRHHQAD